MFSEMVEITPVVYRPIHLVLADSLKAERKGQEELERAELAERKAEELALWVQANR